MVGLSQRELRDLRLQCQRLSNNNEELKVAANAGRMAACSSKKMADAAQRELETERNTCGGLRRVREDLLVTAAEDKKTISRLQAQLCKGAPSSRLLERARCMKRAVEKLESQLKGQAVALSAKTAELERSREEAKALAAALGVRTEKSLLGGVINGGGITVDELLEMGRVKMANHDLALEMASLSETSEIVASEKEKLEGRLSEKIAEVERCNAATAKIRDNLDRERKGADGHRADVSKAHASTRKAEELVETLRSKEKGLVKDLAVAVRRLEEMEEELKALSGAAEKGEALCARADKLQTELHICGAELSAEKLRNAQTCAELRASEDRWHRARQRVEALEEVEGEKRRLEDLLWEAEKLHTSQREHIATAREDLRVVVAERGELLRGLHQAKGFNDELAKGKEKAEQREEEACARCVEIREGKLALQRALLEQLSASRADLREERQRRRKAEETLGRLAHAAGARSRRRTSPPSGNNVFDSDGEGASSSLEATTDVSGALEPTDGRGEVGNTAFTSALVEPARPRDTLVQDYLGTEGAEQFLSDWDEERSSTSSSISLSSSTPPSPRPPPPLLLPVPLKSAPIAAYGGGGDGSEGESGATVERLTSETPSRAKPQPSSLPPSPRQPLTPKAVSSSTHNAPPWHAPNGDDRASSTLQSGQEERSESSALVGTCLNDPSLEKWAASMVALGKTARAGAEPGHAAEAKSVIGRGLSCAAVIRAAGESCATPGGVKTSRGSPAGRSHRSIMVLNDLGVSSDSPQGSQEDRHRRQRQERIHRGVLRQADSPTKRPLEEDEGEEEEKNGGGGDDVDRAGFASRRCKPSRTSEHDTRKTSDLLVGDVGDATVARRAAETPLCTGSGSSPSPLHAVPGGREDGCARKSRVVDTREGVRGDVCVRGAAGGGSSAAVVIGASCVRVASSVPSGSSGGECSGAEIGGGGIADAAGAVHVAEGEPGRPPPCSLLDLADQSIDDI